MSDTPTESKAVRAQPHWAVTVTKLLVPVLLAALAYRGATGTAKEQTDAVKDKAESGYQATKEALAELTKSQATALEAQVAIRGELETVKRDLRLCRRRARGTTARVTVDLASASPSPPAPPRVVMPADLDKALHAQQQAAAAPQTKDGGQ